MSWKSEADELKSIRPRHILFLCVANSARSQMAEGIARSFAPATVRVSSAGSKPSFVHPLAIQVLSEVGIDIRSHQSKAVADFDPRGVDAVITLCADEVCPIFLSNARKLHWGLSDPAAEGDGDAKLMAFRQVRDELSIRLKYLFEAWS